MIEVVEPLRVKLAAVRQHLQLLAEPGLAEQKFNGVAAIRDDRGKPVPGALCYQSGVDGPNAAILGGIHMNEMSGVYALLKFHKRWLNGERPRCGNIYVATGHIERALEFIDTVTAAEKISADQWSAFHATRDHNNYNRIAFDILTRNISNDFEQHAKQIVKQVLTPARGKILDLHNTSTEAEPMVTLFMQSDETPEMVIQRINATGVLNNLPIENFIVWKPGPYNGVESIRCIGDESMANIPILIENGSGANPASFDAADFHTQVWLNNVMAMAPGEQAGGRQSINNERKVYVETEALYHPDVKPDDYSHLDQETLESVRKDTFVLVRDWNSADAVSGWSDKARLVLNQLDQQNFSGSRLKNFMPIRKDELLAIGLNSGFKLLAPSDGVMMMVAASPFVTAQNRETFANIGMLL